MCTGTITYYRNDVEFDSKPYMNYEHRRILLDKIQNMAYAEPDVVFSYGLSINVDNGEYAEDSLNMSLYVDKKQYPPKIKKKYEHLPALVADPPASFVRRTGKYSNTNFQTKYL